MRSHVIKGILGEKYCSKKFKDRLDLVSRRQTTIQVIFCVVWESRLGWTPPNIACRHFPVRTSRTPCQYLRMYAGSSNLTGQHSGHPGRSPSILEVPCCLYTSGFKFIRTSPPARALENGKHLA